MTQAARQATSAEVDLRKPSVQSRLLAKVSWILGRTEVRQAGLVTGGTIAGQIVTIAATPILSRLYGPAEFALLGLLINIAATGGSVGGLCYELGILQPRSRLRARSLFALSMLISVAGSAVVTGLIAIVNALRPGLFGRDLDLPFFVLCYLGVLTTTQYNAVGFAHSRFALYYPIAISKINQSTLPTMLQIGFGLIQSTDLSLMAGRTIGLVATNLWLQRTLPFGFCLRDIARLPWPALLSTSRRYADFLLNVPRQLLMRGATSAPPILLLVAYGPTEAGLFFFAQRLVERPAMLLGDSLTRIPMKQFAQRRAEGKPLNRAAILYTLACAVPILLCCALLAAIARPVLPFVFGHRWTGAIGYVVIMSMWAGLRTSVLPAATLLMVLRKQKISLLTDTIFFPRVLVIPFMAAHSFTALAAVASYCALSMVYDLVTCALGLRAARQHDRALEGPTVPLPS